MSDRALQSQSLSALRGAALFIGALLGPGLLLLPGLAAQQAGAASIIAWLALLAVSALLAAVFAALGRAHPSTSGVTGYTASGLGHRAGRAVGWCFLAGVIGGAPVVCLIGASYITDLTDGGQLARCAIAAIMLLIVLGLTLSGARTSAAVQLALVGLLITIVVFAVAGSAQSARAANWTPFAPHGWSAIGSASATLMLSFVGWEAVAPLTTRLSRPTALPRIITVAFGVTAMIYLGLATATIAVLGPHAGNAPVADLLERAIGPAGRAVAAAAAVVLTLGTTNAYLSGAAAMAADLMRTTGGSDSATRQAPRWRLPAVTAACGVLVLGLCALGLVTTTQLISIPTALFLTVYVGCLLSAARTLAGRVRLAAIAALIAVVIVLLFTGWALAVAAVVVITAWLGRGSAASPARLEAKKVLEALPGRIVLRERGRLGPLDREVGARAERSKSVDQQRVGGQRMECFDEGLRQPNRADLLTLMAAESCWVDIHGLARVDLAADAVQACMDEGTKCEVRVGA